MGIQDMNMGNFDADSARYDRLNRTQQPEFAPGQGGMNTNNLFAQSITPNQGGNINDIFNTTPQSNGLGLNGGTDVFGNPVNGLPNTLGEQPASNSFNMNQPMQNQQPQMTEEEKFFEVSKKAVVGGWNYFKELGNSFRGITSLFVTKWGCDSTFISLGVVVLGVIGRFFGWKQGISFALGGCFSGFIGVLAWFLSADSAKTCTSKFSDTNETIEPPQEEVPEPTMDFSSDFSDNNNFSSSSYDDFPESSWDNNEDDDDYPDFDDPYGDIEDEVVVTPAMSTEEAISTFQPIDRGMYTRQYLYDNFIKVLPCLEPSFTKIVDYDEDTTEFDYWYDILTQASEVIGLKEEEMPELLGLTETLFTIKVKVSRTPKLKPDLLANELANAYAYNIYENDAEKRASVFAKSEVVLKTCIITIFTGKTHMVSLRDMYNECNRFILDTNNYMPVVVGINEAGKVITMDFKKIESIIVAGMPRSGKTWWVQAILTQLCALNSPKDLNIYFLDPKAGTSDYKRFYLPHVKVFASRYNDSNGNVVNKEFRSILDTLRQLVNVEAPRRKKLIGDGGCVNINDYKEKYPDVKLPYIVVVIDEMVTLSTMEKEDCKEYMTYLDQIVTQFPNLGIRGMFIPHEVKNQIISKTAYDSVKARISVKGSQEHIESSTGTKPKDFPYKLCNTGDMAVNIDTISASTQFIHGVALTSSNADNIKLFDYLRRIWNKLEPDEVAGSWATVADSGNEDLLKEAQEPVETGELFSNVSEAGYLSFDDVNSQEDDDEFDLFS